MEGRRRKSGGKNMRKVEKAKVKKNRKEEKVIRQNIRKTGKKPKGKKY